MNSGPLIFLGILFTLASSFYGLLVLPQARIGRQDQVEIQPSGQLYPPPRPGLAQQGAEVYRANGCAECHTRQVRPQALGADLARGWGQRFTVAQDYLRDYPVMLGNLRLGPDLANVGLRRPDETWHLMHLYQPKHTSPGSTMPAYRYLFEELPLPAGKKPAPDALPLEVAPAGYQVVPRPEARALVAYLVSQKAHLPLFEAPAPAAATNAAPAGATNSPAPAK